MQVSIKTTHNSNLNILGATGSMDKRDPIYMTLNNNVIQVPQNTVFMSKKNSQIGKISSNYSCRPTKHHSFFPRFKSFKIFEKGSQIKIKNDIKRAHSLSEKEQEYKKYLV